MDERFRQSFDRIRAGEELKTATREFLRQEREKRQPRPRRWGRPLASFCAVLGLMLVVGLVRAVYYTPVAYVSIDVNPSIELEINRFDQVVSASAYNPEGREVLKPLSLRGRGYVQAVEQILESETMSFYLRDSRDLTVTVAAGDEKRERDILSAIRQCDGYRQHHGQSDCADQSLVQQARQCGMSLGRYAAYQTLSQYDSSVTPQQCQEMTMAELHAHIRACEGHGASHSPSGGGHHGGGG